MIRGKLVKRKRLQLKMSQEELAKMIGYNDRTSICKIEKEANIDIPLSKAVKLAEVLQISLPELIKKG